MRETISFFERRAAIEYLRDITNDAVLLELPNGLLRLPQGPGWLLTDGADGKVHLASYSARECDEIERGERDAAEDQRQEEALLRELSRQSRELAPAAFGAGR